MAGLGYSLKINQEHLVLIVYCGEQVKCIDKKIIAIPWSLIMA
jgi:hypothetical protein